jgi:hypothetical protein
MTEASKITIKYPERHLYNRFPGQANPQPAYIELAGDGGLSADYSGEIGGNSMPMDVWQGRRQQWSIPSSLSVDAICRVLDAIEPLAQRVFTGLSIDWDGSNWVGKLNVDASDASDEIEQYIEREIGSEDHLTVQDATDYYALDDSSVRDQIADGVSDDEIAENEEHDAKLNGIDILENLEKFIANLRDEMEEDD